MPVLIGAEVIDNCVVVRAQSDILRNKKITVKIRLSGIRVGFGGRRFEEHSYEYMIKNNSFWDSWKNS